MDMVLWILAADGALFGLAGLMLPLLSGIPLLLGAL